MNQQHHKKCFLPPMNPLPVHEKALEKSFVRYLNYHLGRFLGCRDYYFYEALALTTRDRIMPHWRDTWNKQKQSGKRRAYYMSLEFLMGRALGNHLLNLGMETKARNAMHELSLNIEEILDSEPDAGLGNGGLGRLAACFLDSCATLSLPVLGYGLRYEYGMFRQDIINGEQVEEPDHWLRDGHPWELERSEYVQTIKFGGRTESVQDPDGSWHMRWVDTHDILAIPFDVPVSGYCNNTINTLRLWKSSATDEFDLEEFNEGSYTDAVAAKTAAEDITMVLYPNDASENGKELRLRQQYFLASASLQDVIRQWEQLQGDDFSEFAAQNVFQMNDTHPTIAVAELMRILLDEKKMGWDDAWSITTRCMAYTNHTLLPEALERWPVKLFENWKSSTKSTPVSCARCRNTGPATPRARNACPSSRKVRKKWCAWPGWPSSAVFPSTALPNCTPICWYSICSGTSTSCGRKNSTTRPTASRRAAGLPMPTPA